MTDPDPTYNFLSSEPAHCLTQGRGAEGVYLQRECCWYYDGNLACQINHLPHLSQQEMLVYGRERLRNRLANGGDW